MAKVIVLSVKGGNANVNNGPVEGKSAGHFQGIIPY